MLQGSRSSQRRPVKLGIPALCPPTSPTVASSGSSTSVGSHRVTALLLAITSSSDGEEEKGQLKEDGVEPVDPVIRSGHTPRSQGVLNVFRRFLYTHGADVNGGDKYGLTPLHYACMRGASICFYTYCFISLSRKHRSHPRAFDGSRNKHRGDR